MNEAEEVADQVQEVRFGPLEYHINQGLAFACQLEHARVPVDNIISFTQALECC
jgi:hypothetical protein